MKRLILVVFLLFSVAMAWAAAGKTDAVPLAKVQAIFDNDVLTGGEIIGINGQNFNPDAQIKAVVLIVQKKNGKLDYRPIQDYQLHVDLSGNLTGTITLPFFQVNDNKVRILVSVAGNDVLPTPWMPVSGTEQSVPNNVQGSAFTYGEASGDGIVQLGERLDITSSSTDWTGNVLSCIRNEYSTSNATGTPVAQVGLDVSNLSISGGQLTGYTTNSTQAYDATTITMRLAVMDGSFSFTESTNYFSTKDTIPPNLTTARATSLTTITVIFDEAVSEVGGDAAGKFTLSGTTAKGTALNPVGTPPTTQWHLTLDSNLPDRAATGVTIAYNRSNTGPGSLQDNAGNEVATTSPAISVADSIPPATPTLTNPTDNTIMTTSVLLKATADDGTTDPSMAGVTFQGSNDGSTWTDLGTDNNTADNIYSYTYTFGTKYSYYRAVAKDNNNLATNSSPSPNFSDAYRIEITQWPANLDPGVRGKFYVNIQNNYTDSTTYGANLSINLASSQSTGTFYDQPSGGNQITSIIINSGSYGGSFWYMDTNDNSNPIISVTESAHNLTDPTDSQQIHINAVVVDHFAVKTGNNQNETAGTAFDVIVEAHDASHNIITTYVGSHTLTWSTNATASPKGNNPVIPANGSYTFTNGTLTITGGATFYNSAETPYLRVTDENNTQTSTTEAAGSAVTVNDGPAAEVVIKTKDETTDGLYSAHVFMDTTVQGPTQANPDKQVNVYAIVYDAYGNLRPKETGLWGKSTGFDGNYTSSGLTTSNTYVFSAGSNQGTTYTGYLTFTSSVSSLSDQTGTITVDDDDPATVTNFNIATDPDNNMFVFATWDGTSSGDDGTTGTPTDYDIRWVPESNGPIDTDAEWNNATSVGTAGKPPFSSGSWHIDMSGFPPGNKYFAIRTYDDVNNVSVLGSGSYTTSPDYSLPVELSAFEAKGSYGKVILNWETASETNNEGFFIYRSEQQDGNFIRINPEIIPGNGNSNATHHYSYTDKNVEEGKTYYYKLASRDFSGQINEYPKIVSATVLEIPKQFSIEQNFPNPFNPETHFRFAIAKPSHVSLVIYNILGQKVRTVLQDAYYEPGVYENVAWNATDDAGNKVPNGIYYYVFSVKEFNFHQVKKLAYIK